MGKLGKNPTELKKAIAVCQSGLGIYPESIEGNFIMAQIQILEAKTFGITP